MTIVSRAVRGPIVLTWLLALLTVTTAAAQTSSSYKLEETSINSGGNPRNGVHLASSSFQVTFDALGDPVVTAGLASASFHMEGGFVGAFPPPGPVGGFNFATPSGFTWDSEPSAGTYNLYRGVLNGLPGTYGSCNQSGLQNTGWIEAADPAPGQGWFYLVTVENRLLEEGTKGYTSGGVERSNSSPCP